MHEVIMPKLGLTMETGVIEKWHKKEGDKVETGEVLFEVMTDKVSLEVEAYHSGILRKILKKEGEEVPVTQVIAYIGNMDEDIPTVSLQSPEADTTSQKKLEEKMAGAESEVKTATRAAVETSTDVSRIKISPLARNIAEKRGIDIAKIKGTGPDGRIVKEDVENYAEEMASGKAAAEETPVAVSEVSKQSEAPADKLSERIRISPLARNTAKELGIDYIKEPIKGTGPDGRITKEDVLAFAESRKKAVSAPEIKPAAAAASASRPAQAARIKSSVPMKGMRKVIAERLTYSKQNIPHIILTSVMDVEALIALREKIKDKVSAIYGTKITYTDFIIKACASVLAEQPVVNASLQDNNHIIFEDINIGLAVSVESGLIVPTIYGTDRLSLFDIAKKRMELVEKAKAGRLTMEEISNGTFTISNLGMFGIRNFTAIINPPQGAILTIGEIYKAPAVLNDKIEIRHLMQVSVAVDHRIIDGADAAKYLARLKEIIENPELLLI